MECTYEIPNMSRISDFGIMIPMFDAEQYLLTFDFMRMQYAHG
jgi:hypothetical protein